MTMREYDVVVVGGGLVGASLACTLATQLPSINIALVEAGVPPSALKGDGLEAIDTRVSALNASSVHCLQAAGIWAYLPTERVAVYEKMMVWDGEGQGAVTFDCRDMHNLALGHIVENTTLRVAAWQALNTFNNIHIFQQDAVTKLEDKIITLASGVQLEMSCLIAADGSYSEVRSLAGFALQQTDMQQRAIVATVRTEKQHANTAWQCFHHDGPLAFLPLAAGKDCSSIVWSLDTETADQMLALEDNGFAGAVTCALEHRLGKVLDVSSRHSVLLVQRQALNYVKNHVVLVGDAAHSIHPLAGQGVNLGLKDIVVLAQEFVRAQKRQLPLDHASVLARYQRQRIGENKMAALSMQGFKRLFGEPNAAVLMARNLGFQLVDRSPQLKRFFMRVANG